MNVLQKKTDSLDILGLLDLEDEDIQREYGTDGSTNATDMLIVLAYRDLTMSTVAIAEKFGNLLETYRDPIINSFVMVEKTGKTGIYQSRLSNGPVESINRKVKDLKHSGRGFRNFEHFRNRFLYAARSEPVLNGIEKYNPVKNYD